MRCLAAIVVVLVSAATLSAQPSGDLSGATHRFMGLERKLGEMPRGEYSATREKLAEQALALARTSPNSRDAESLLHWILRSQRASPTVQDAVECLLKHHAQAEATLRRLPYYAEHRVGESTVKEIAAGAIFAVRHLRHGKTAGELAGKSTDGMQVSLEDHRGKVVLIDFWNSACSPSLCAMPVLKDTQEQLGRLRFTLFGVSGDREKSKLERSMQDLEIDWPNIVDADGALRKRWQAIHLPYYYVLDAKHVVRYRGDDYRKAILVASSLVEKERHRDGTSGCTAAGTRVSEMVNQRPAP